MECATHAGVEAIPCTGCGKGCCASCLVFAIDGAPACEACGAGAGERSRSMGFAVLGVVAVGYLATLAIGVLVFRARPFVGGLAAVVAIGIGRALQVRYQPPVVTRLPEPR